MIYLFAMKGITQIKNNQSTSTSKKNLIFSNEIEMYR